MKFTRLLFLKISLLVAAGAAADTARWVSAMQAGDDAFGRGELRRAARSYQDALTATKILPDTDWRRAGALNNRAVALSAAGEHEKALSALDQALTVFAQGFGPDAALSLPALHNVAAILSHQAAPDRSREHLQRLVETAERELGPEHRQTALALADLARWLVVNGELGAARTHIERGLAVAANNEAASAAALLLVKAELESANGDFDQALATVETAVAQFTAEDAPATDLAYAKQQGAAALTMLARYAEAVAKLDEIQGELTESRRGEHPTLASVLEQKAGIHLIRAEFDVAEALFKRARAIRNRAQGRNHPETAANIAGLASVYLAQGRDREAAGALAQAEKMLAKTPLSAVFVPISLNRAKLALAQARLTDARVAVEQALGAARQNFGNRSPILLPLYFAHAELALYRRDPAGARASLDRVAELLGADGGPNHHHEHILRRLDARIHEQQGDTESALQAFDEAVASARQPKAAEPRALAVLTLDYANALIRADAFEAAADLLRQTEESLSALLGTNHPLVAGVIEAMGRVALASANFETARQSFTRALSIREESLPAGHVSSIRSLTGLGAAEFGLARYSESEQLLKRALTTGERAHGREDVRLVPVLVAYAQVQRIQAKFSDAHKSIDRALKLSKSSSERPAPAAAPALMGHGDLLLAYGRYAQAGQQFLRALDVGDSQSLEERNPYLLRLQVKLAGLAGETGDWRNADEWLARAETLSEGLPDDHRDGLRVRRAKARSMTLRGHYSVARESYEQVLADLEGKLPATHPRVLSALLALAELEVLLGDYSEAAERALAVSDVGGQALGERHPLRIAALILSVKAKQRAGDPAGAEEAAKIAAGLAEKTYGFRHPVLGEIYRLLGLSYLAQGKITEAQTILRRAKSTLERTLGRDSPELRPIHDAIAQQLVDQAKFTQASELAEMTLANLAKVFGEDGAKTIPARMNTARVLSIRGDDARAISHIEKAAADHDRLFAKTHPGRAEITLALADSLVRVGRAAEARKMLAAALEEFAAGPHAEHPARLPLMRSLAQRHMEAGDLDEAEQLLDAAITDTESRLGEKPPLLADLFLDKAALALETGRGDAVAEGRRAAEALAASYGEDHVRTVFGQAFSQLVISLRGDERADFLPFLAALEEGLGGAHPAIGLLSLEIGLLQSQTNRLAAATTTLRRAGENLERAFGAGHPDWVRSQIALGTVLLNAGEAQRANSIARHAWSKAGERLGPGHPATIKALAALANSQAATQDDAAADTYQQALASAEKLYGEDHPEVANIGIGAGRLATRMGHTDLAEKHFAHALRVVKARRGDTHPSVADLNIALGELYQSAGRKKAAKERYSDALRIRQAAFGGDALPVAVVLERIASVAFDMDDFKGARDGFLRAIEIRKTLETDRSAMVLAERNLAGVYLALGEYDLALETLGQPTAASQ